MTAKTFSDAALMIRYLTIPLSKAALKRPPAPALMIRYLTIPLSKAALKIRAFGVPEL